MKTRAMNNKKEKGILAIFDHPNRLLAAVKKVRQAGIRKLDTFTPYAIHGLDHAAGLKRSWIPYATLILSLTGWCLGFLFQAWTSAVDWPLNVGGKPFVSWPAFIPITFESMVLIGGVSTVLILFITCGLPNRKLPALDPRFTDDRFGLFVDKNDPYFDEAKLRHLLKECDAEEIKNVA
ncbi:MAG: DUF3341 domain-containing protein [Deltaproteobacteria bacterium]|nr:DUF3341 domain-containing protein [Deltaproteobacteria bacterium]